MCVSFTIISSSVPFKGTLTATMAFYYQHLSETRIPDLYPYPSNLVLNLAMRNGKTKTSWIKFFSSTFHWPKAEHAQLSVSEVDKQ